MDRGQALIIYAEAKSTISEMRGAINRVCAAKKFSAVSCSELADMSRQLGTLEDSFQEKILNSGVVVDVKKVVTALRLAAAIAGKLL